MDLRPDLDRNLLFVIEDSADTLKKAGGVEDRRSCPKPKKPNVAYSLRTSSWRAIKDLPKEDCSSFPALLSGSCLGAYGHMADRSEQSGSGAKSVGEIP